MDQILRLKVLKSGGLVCLQLPNVWLWDMVDEFIYQFQSFAQYRGRLHEKSAEEVSLLRKACASGFWDIAQVLTYLQTLAEKSGIAQDLSTSSAPPPLPPSFSPPQQGLRHSTALGQCLHACNSSFSYASLQISTFSP